jgi:selenocysteine lyase/cysteine desulfurase
MHAQAGLVHKRYRTGGAEPCFKCLRHVARRGVLSEKPSVLSLLLDAARTAGVYPIDVQALGIDFLAFTGLKGLLYKGCLHFLYASQYGGRTAYNTALPSKTICGRLYYPSVSCFTERKAILQRLPSKAPHYFAGHHEASVGSALYRGSLEAFLYSALQRPCG